MTTDYHRDPRRRPRLREESDGDDRPGAVVAASV